jgi:hypothetical protein
MSKIKEFLGNVEKEGFKVELTTEHSSLTANTKTEADIV